MLTAREIHKYYGSLWVLKGVDVTIGKGEIVSIVGPSGSGKSTLLHILGTLDEPAKGTINLAGRQINELKGRVLAAFRNRHIGFVFQFHHLLPEFSALENVCIPGWIAGRRKKRWRSGLPSCYTRWGSVTGWRISPMPCLAGSSKGWRWRGR